MLKKILKPILIVIGVLSLLLGIMLFVTTQSAIKKSITTMATVIDHKVTHRDRRDNYQCILQYKHKNGKQVQFTQAVQTTGEPKYEINEKVEIIYNPKKENSHKVNTFFDIYFLPGVLSFFGMGMTTFGFFFHKFKERNR